MAQSQTAASRHVIPQLKQETHNLATSWQQANAPSAAVTNVADLKSKYKMNPPPTVEEEETYKILVPLCDVLLFFLWGDPQTRPI